MAPISLAMKKSFKKLTKFIGALIVIIALNDWLIKIIMMKMRMIILLSN